MAYSKFALCVVEMRHILLDQSNPLMKRGWKVLKTVTRLNFLTVLNIMMSLIFSVSKILTRPSR